MTVMTAEDRRWNEDTDLVQRRRFQEDAEWGLPTHAAPTAAHNPIDLDPWSEEVATRTGSLAVKAWSSAASPPPRMASGASPGVPEKVKN